MKVTNLDLFNTLKELRLEINELKKHIEQYESFDSTIYIRGGKDNFTMIWYHKGNYYARPSELYETIVANYGYNGQKQTFRNLLTSAARQSELKQYEINLVYMAPLGEKHGITTLGHVVYKSSLHKIKTELNRAVFKEFGERYLVNIGAEVYRAFIDPSYEEQSLHYRDHDMSNNRIDNLEPHKKEYLGR